MITNLLARLVSSIVRPLGSRLIGAALVALSGKFALMAGVEIQPETIKNMQEFAVGLTIYLVTHKLFDRKLNPADAAHPTQIEDNPFTIK